MEKRLAEPRHWRPGDAIDITGETDLRRWAKRLCVTLNELLEILEETGDHGAALAARHLFAAAPDQAGDPVRH
ncbi:MAG: hypothetical protein ACHP7N_16500 [Caulobacterales bacterium]